MRADSSGDYRDFQLLPDRGRESLEVLGPDAAGRRLVGEGGQSGGIAIAHAELAGDAVEDLAGAIGLSKEAVEAGGENPSRWEAKAEAVTATIFTSSRHRAAGCAGRLPCR